MVNLDSDDRATQISPPPLKRRKLYDYDDHENGRVDGECDGSEDLSDRKVIAEGHSDGNRDGDVNGSANTLRIFAWNVNGIATFVEAYLHRGKGKGIESFFERRTTTNTARSTGSNAGHQTRKRGRRSRSSSRSNSSNASDDNGEDPSSGRNVDLGDRPGRQVRPYPPSLRGFLKRHRWPQILLLQEVKINPKDTKSQEAMKRAVNDDDRSGVQPDPTKGASESAEPIILADGGPEYDVYFNLPRDPYNAKGFGKKVYGVASIIARHFGHQYVRKVRKADWDLEGRVQILEAEELHFSTRMREIVVDDDSASHCEHDEKPSIAVKMAIVNIYAPNGTTNPYRSSATGEMTGTRHDHKLAFHQNLLSEALDLQARGFQVILAGDMNIASGHLDGWPNLRTWPTQHCLNRADFNEKFFGHADNDGSEDVRGFNKTKHSHDLATFFELSTTEKGQIQKNRSFNGIDTFRHIHGKERKYSYHSPSRTWGSSCDRVDLIISSRGAMELGSLVSAGILDSIEERSTSDHCPIWVEYGRLIHKGRAVT